MRQTADGNVSSIPWSNRFTRNFSALIASVLKCAHLKSLDTIRRYLDEFAMKLGPTQHG